MAHPVTSVGALLAEVFRFSGLWICTTGPRPGAVNVTKGEAQFPGRSFSSDILGFIFILLSCSLVTWHSFTSVPGPVLDTGHR